MDWAALQRVVLALTSAALCRTARGAPIQQSLLSVASLKRQIQASVP